MLKQVDRFVSIGHQSPLALIRIHTHFEYLLDSSLCNEHAHDVKFDLI